MTSFGLDSLMAIQLKNRIETSLGVALSIVDMLAGLSLGGLAEKVCEEHDRREQEDSGRVGRRNGTHTRPSGEPQTNGATHNAAVATRPRSTISRTSRKRSWTRCSTT